MISYEIADHISGNTWCGISTITFTRDNSALDLTGAYLEMQVRLSIDSPMVLSLNTTNSGIVVLSPPTSGSVYFPSQIITLPPADYKYELKLFLPTGETRTYLSGIWKILPSFVK